MNKTVRNYGGEAVGSMVHDFERAGLGKAPFRFLRQEVVLHQVPGEMPRAGSSCDFCANAIANVFWLKGSGHGDTEFKVGCDCVARTGDAGLRRVVDAKVAEMNRKRAHARDDAKIEDAKARLARLRPLLASEPHPMSWHAAKGLTLADYAEWMLVHAGRKGGVHVAKELLLLEEVVTASQ